MTIEDIKPFLNWAVEDCHVEEFIVHNWWNKHLIRDYMNRRLKQEYRFKNHVVKERDNFGPVTSVLTIEHIQTKEQYELLI